MRMISVGEAELKVVQSILDAVESGLPTPRLNAKKKQALRTFLRRLGADEPATDWQCPNCHQYQYKVYGYECDECGTMCPDDQR